MKVLRIFQSVLYFVFDLQPVRGNVATPNMHLVLVVDYIGFQSQILNGQRVDIQ
jgi:hypothetical protein